MADEVRSDYNPLERCGDSYVLCSIHGSQILIFYADVLILSRFLNRSSTQSIIINLSSIYCFDTSFKSAVWVG